MRSRLKALRSRLAEREIEICLRLKRAREVVGLTQEKCAEALGIPKSRLSNYELCRAPVRSDLALLFCQHFVVSEKWLATGEGDMRKLAFLRTAPEGSGIAPGALFSAAFDRDLLNEYERRAAGMGDSLFSTEVLELRRHPDPCFVRHAVNYLLEAWLKLVPSEDQIRLFHALAIAGYGFLQEHGVAPVPSGVEGPGGGLISEHRQALLRSLTPGQREEVERIREEMDLVQKKLLTLTLRRGNVGLVKAQMPQLLDRLKQATEPAGKLTELARFLKAPLPSVSRWVNGKRKPGTETTLQLLHWVQEEERNQQQSAASARTPAAPKTLVRRFKHEKPTSGPKEH